MTLMHGDYGVLAKIKGLERARGCPVQADDQALFEGIPPRSAMELRRAILRLVDAGFLTAGDGFIRVAGHG